MILNNETIKLINLFESMTKARVKDCFFERESVVFVVENGEMGKAIGKHGVHIKKVESNIKRKIRVVEFNSEIKKFIINYLLPIKIQDIKEENGIIEIKVGTTREKGILIGRERSNLDKLKEVVNKYFKVSDIHIV